MAKVNQDETRIPAVGQSRSMTDAMVAGEAYKRYKKTILGKVHITALDPFSDRPTGILLKGNPNNAKDNEDTIIEIWDERQDIFFKRLNRKHFDAGRLIEIKKPQEPERSVNDLTDSEIDSILSSRFLALKAKLDSFTSEAPVFRLLNRARELDKSAKIVAHIEERLTQLQLEGYQKDEPSE